jgi:nucleoside-diphosphate-sugar epimerase/uncharacterized membrane protein
VAKARKPIVLITGAGGNIGTALAAALRRDYRVVGFDLKQSARPTPIIACDLTSDASVGAAFATFRRRYGGRIAAVVHLAAYFDFTGEDHPLYHEVNVGGTRRLLAQLQDFEVGVFVYSGTMLIHAPGTLTRRVDETAPIAPKWAYPESKAEAERIIKDEHGRLPYVLLHLAGLYDDRTAVPTLAQQIARIYERDFRSHLYPGDLDVGQAFVHEDDMVDAFRRVIDRRQRLRDNPTILVGEPEVMSFRELQDEIGRLVHGEEEWATIEMPKLAARVGAWLEEKAEPLIPDVIDRGEQPFVRPFMVDLADDHYALDITRARELLGWTPKHRIRDALPRLVSALKDDPLGWYKANRVTPPGWLEAAAAAVDDPEALRVRHERGYREEHRRNLWAHFATMGMGAWLAASPATFDYGSAWLAWSDAITGAALVVLGFLSLSPQFGWARWATAAVGAWLMTAPLVFWAPTAASLLNDTLVGALVIGFAVLTRPPPGVGLVGRMTGPTVPPGWDYSPSSWLQRLPIIVLAVVGLHISRYLAAYQLGHVEGVWEPFFAGSLADPQNGTEEIITSEVSRAWPVPDAGLGALTYMLEILTGIIGSARRWRTMPWLVILFGVMIAPLGIVSITFIIIQPIVIGTWCTLCLIAAVAMLVQIPYSLDELVASCQFLARRRRAGQSVVRVFFVGDTDEGGDEKAADEFDRPPREMVREMAAGGVGLPWNLAAAIVIGVWLMCTRLTLGAEGGMADADHLVGALVVTVSAVALADVARPVRLLNVILGSTLFVTPFAYDVGWTHALASLACGLALIALSVRRGPIGARYGSWDRLIF